MLLAANWVSDNTSFLVGTVLGVLGILTGSYFYWRGRRRKTLDWELVGHNVIVEVAAARSVKLQVRWSGKEVVHPALAILRVVNTGREPISASDIVEPVTVSITGGKLLSVDLTETPTTDFLDGSMITGSSSVAMVPKLLNPSESFTVQLFLDAQNPDANVTARIAGLTRPVSNLANIASRRRKIAGYPLIGVILAISAWQLWSSSSGVAAIEQVSWIGGFLSLSVALFALVTNRSSK